MAIVPFIATSTLTPSVVTTPNHHVENDSTAKPQNSTDRIHTNKADSRQNTKTDDRRTDQQANSKEPDDEPTKDSFDAQLKEQKEKNNQANSDADTHDQSNASTDETVKASSDKVDSVYIEQTDSELPLSRQEFALDTQFESDVLLQGEQLRVEQSDFISQFQSLTIDQSSGDTHSDQDIMLPLSTNHLSATEDAHLGFNTLEEQRLTRPSLNYGDLNGNQNQKFTQPGLQALNQSIGLTQGEVTEQHQSILIQSNRGPSNPVQPLAIQENRAHLLTSSELNHELQISDEGGMIDDEASVNRLSQLNTTVGNQNSKLETGAYQTQSTSLITEAMDLAPNEGGISERLEQIKSELESISTTHARQNQAKLIDDKVQANAVKSSLAPFKMDVPPNHSEWGDKLMQKVIIMNADKLQTAHIQLDPPELGQMEVRIKVQNDQVSVSFHSNHAAVRDALDSQSAKLREMLEQQGVSLSDMNVADQGQQGEQNNADEDESNDWQSDALSENQNAESSQQMSVAISDKLVDDFV